MPLTAFVRPTPLSRWPFEAILYQMRDGMLAEYVRSAYGFCPDEALRRLEIDRLGVTVVIYRRNDNVADLQSDAGATI